MILMLNCSYKTKDSNTQYYLELLKKDIDKEVEIINIRYVLNNNLDIFLNKLNKAESLIIGAPLYVDGLPSQAIKLLELLLEYKDRYSNKNIYVVSNLGFYEAKQISPLFDIVKNWTKRMNMVYGGGLAIGAGPMVSIVNHIPVLKLLNTDVYKGVQLLAKAINNNNTIENYYTKTYIPRLIYLKAAHLNFNNTLKQNNVI